MLDGAAVPERLIEAADRALYKAKCEGRDQARSAAAVA
jgi:PleD family two-component response regulator